MSALLLILLSTVLVNVIVLEHRPAWRPFAVVSADVFAGARGIALASLITVPAVTTLSWLLAVVLLDRWGLQYLRTLVFVMVVLSVVPLVEALLRRRGKLLPQRPGFALLMTTNSTVLGVALLAAQRMRSVLDALLLAVAAALALGLLLLAFAALQEKLRHADVPAAFREAPLALLTAGIAALAFMGFTGLVQE